MAAAREALSARGGALARTVRTAYTRSLAVPSALASAAADVLHGASDAVRAASQGTRSHLRQAGSALQSRLHDLVPQRPHARRLGIASTALLSAALVASVAALATPDGVQAATTHGTRTTAAARAVPGTSGTPSASASSDRDDLSMLRAIHAQEVRAAQQRTAAQRTAPAHPQRAVVHPGTGEGLAQIAQAWGMNLGGIETLNRGLQRGGNNYNLVFKSDDVTVERGFHAAMPPQAVVARPQTAAAVTPAPAPTRSRHTASVPAQPVTPSPTYYGGNPYPGKWACIAQHEAGGVPASEGGMVHANTGNGFVDGLQFLPSTWYAYGGGINPLDASVAQQVAVAERVLAGQGWGAWPNTSRMCGYR